MAQTVVIDRTVSGGKKDCCGNVTYGSTSATWNQYNSKCTIVCSGRGNNVCPEKCATQSTEMGDLVGLANDAIEAGTMSGTLIDGVLTVTWSAWLNAEGVPESDIIVTEN